MFAVLHHKHMEFSCRQTASSQGVSKSSVSRWTSLFDRTKAVVNKPRKTRKDSKVPQLCGLVASLVATDPFTTIARIQWTLQSTHNLHVSASSVYRCMKHAKLSYKVATRSPQHQIMDPNHPFLDALNDNVYRDGISIDEACFVSCDAPKRGWALPRTAVPKRPPKRRQTVSLLLAIDRNGVVAHCIQKGSFNTISFTDFVSSLPHGRPLIMDNVAFHRSISVKDVAQANCSTIHHTPPYCPWFNPVEHAFSVCKSWFRQARVRRASGAGYLVEDVVSSIQAVTDNKCRAFFDHTARVRCRVVARPLKSGTGIDPLQV